MMITSEKKIGRCISIAARRIMSSTVDRLARRSRSAESPQDVLHHDQVAVDDDAEIDGAKAEEVRRDAGRCMHTNAKSSDSGIVTAVRSAARTLPRVNDSTRTTMTRASVSVREIVRRVLATSSVRS